MMGVGILGAALMALMMAGMLLGGHRLGKKGAESPKGVPQTAVCPVSGNRLAVSTTTAQATVGGKLYFFDNEEHLREFVLNPEKFLKAPARGEP